MNRTLFPVFVLLGAALPALAQDAPRVDRIPQMQQIAQALGVECSYCHSAARGSGEAEPKKEIARTMMAMTDDINARIHAATGKGKGQVTDIQCAYCHRGVPVPRPIGDIVWRTARDNGVAAAVFEYRDLRQHFYGRSTYDFGEDVLIVVAYQLANARADDAIALMNLNLEFYPQSARSYLALAFAQTRKLDDRGAIASLEKALEIEPNNAEARGRLEQLKSYHRQR